MNPEKPYLRPVRPPGDPPRGGVRGPLPAVPLGYFILVNDEIEGPYTLGQLRSLWNGGGITSETLYCQEGFPGWVPLQIIIR